MYGRHRRLRELQVMGCFLLNCWGDLGSLLRGRRGLISLIERRGLGTADGTMSTSPQSPQSPSDDKDPSTERGERKDRPCTAVLLLLQELKAPWARGRRSTPSFAAQDLPCSPRVLRDRQKINGSVYVRPSSSAPCMMDAYRNARDPSFPTTSLERAPRIRIVCSHGKLSSSHPTNHRREREPPPPTRNWYAKAHRVGRGLEERGEKRQVHPPLAGKDARNNVNCPWVPHRA